MKILVTGGAGFIGSEFVRVCVQKGYEIIVVDKLSYAGDLARLDDVKDKITFYQTDICNKEEINLIFKKEQPEIIVHMAAESHVDRSIEGPEVFIETNVSGTLTLLEAAKKFNVKRFLNISTDEVYGDLGEEGEFTEETPLSPSSPYSASKAAADMLGRSYLRTFNLPVITVRPSNNYGPWQYPEKLIPVAISKILKSDKIPVYAQGKNVREWLYVNDCANAVLLIMEKGEIGEIYNVGGASERENIYVIKSILKELGKGEELISYVKDRLGHDFRYSLDCDKIKEELGWKPTVKFEEGVKTTVKWYVEHKEWLEKHSS